MQTDLLLIVKLNQFSAIKPQRMIIPLLIQFLNWDHDNFIHIALAFNIFSSILLIIPCIVVYAKTESSQAKTYILFINDAQKQTHT